MTSRLALGEPVVSFTIRIRFPRIKSRDERLRERATAYVDAVFLRHYGEQNAWRYAERKRVRVATHLAERRAVLGRVSRVSRWRPLLRRAVLNELLRIHGIAKWW